MVLLMSFSIPLLLIKHRKLQPFSQQRKMHCFYLSYINNFSLETKLACQFYRVLIGRLNIKNIVCRDLTAPQFHINIANAIEKMRKTKHFHFHLPLPPPKAPFYSEKQKKYSYMHIHTHTLNKMCAVIFKGTIQHQLLLHSINAHL